jgi:GNAT superfamily N-acetyltransferase
MSALELSQLTIAPAETDADLEAMIHIRRLVTPEARPTVENLRFNLDADPNLVYLVARAGGDPVACGFVHSLELLATGDIAVVPDRRRNGVGSAMLDALSVKESDAESRAFLEHRGFVKVGGEQALVLELEEIEEPSIDPPPGVRVVSRVEEPDLLEGMYEIGAQADEDIPGSVGVQTFEQWRANEIDKPSRRPELSFVALAGEEVVGYAALMVFGDEAHHGLTATRRNWRRRGVAAALKRAEIAAAKSAGFRRLLTESEERNEPMRRLNLKLGFVPAPEHSTVVMRGPLA